MVGSGGMRDSLQCQESTVETMSRRLGLAVHELPFTGGLRVRSRNGKKFLIKETNLGVWRKVSKIPEKV